MSGLHVSLSPQVVQKLILYTVLGMSLYQCGSLILRHYSHLLPSFIAVYQGSLPGFAALHHAHAPNFCRYVCKLVTAFKPYGLVCCRTC